MFYWPSFEVGCQGKDFWCLTYRADKVNLHATHNNDQRQWVILLVHNDYHTGKVYYDPQL